MRIIRNKRNKYITKNKIYKIEKYIFYSIFITIKNSYIIYYIEYKLLIV